MLGQDSRSTAGGPQRPCPAAGPRAHRCAREVASEDPARVQAGEVAPCLGEQPGRHSCPHRARTAKPGSRRLLRRVCPMLPTENGSTETPSPGSARTPAKSRGSSCVLCALLRGGEGLEQPQELHTPVSWGAAGAVPSSAPASAAAGVPLAERKGLERRARRWEAAGSNVG